MSTEPRTWTLVRLSNSGSWCIAAGDVEARPEGMVDVASGIIVVESVPVIEREPALDLLERAYDRLVVANHEDVDDERDCLVCQIQCDLEALLRAHGRLKGDNDAS